LIWPAIPLSVLGVWLVGSEVTGRPVAEWMLIMFPLALKTIVWSAAEWWAKVAGALVTTALILATYAALDGVLPEMWGLFAIACTSAFGGTLAVSCLHHVAARRASPADVGRPER
jgi:hypothetical protein